MPDDWRLACAVLGGAFVIVLAVHVLWLVPAAMAERARADATLVARLEDDLRREVRLRGAKSPAAALRTVRGLVEAQRMMGAMVVSGQQYVFGEFGAAPGTGAIAFRRDGVRSRVTRDGCCVDVHLGAERSGFGYDVIARASRSGVLEAVRRTIRHGTMSGLVTAALAAILIALLHRIFIGRPFAAAMRGLRSLDAADIETPTRPKQDTAPAEFDEVPVDILRFEPDGTLCHANASALSLFGIGSVGELRGRDLAIFRTSGDDAPATLPELIRDGPLDLALEISLGGDWLPYVASARQTRDADGEAGRLTVCLMPDTREPSGTPGDTDDRHKALAQKATHQKLLLECCLTLIAPQSNEGVLAAHGPVSTDLVVEAWYGEAVGAGLISPLTQHQVHGRMVGEPDTVANILRHALTYMMLRSAADLPMLTLAGVPVSPRAMEFAIDLLDEPDVPAAPPAAEVAAGDDPSNLPYLALRRLLAAYGGQVMATEDETGKPLLRFVIRSQPVKVAPPPAERQAAA